VQRPIASSAGAQLRRQTGKHPGQSVLHSLGFLVADASLRLLFANHEARAILSYPESPLHNLADAFNKQVRPSLLRAQDSSSNRNLAQVKSGRRTYFCRAFLLDRDAKDSQPTAVLIMLERGMSGSMALSQLSRHFRLTRREQEAVALLLQGLNNNEIAEHMGICANTLKNFLRLAAIKMGVPTRSGIVSKILELVLSSGSS